jgi:rod shape-determining protein MreC
MRTGNREGKRPRREHYVFIGLCFISFFCLLFSTRSFIIDFRDAGLSVFSGARSGAYSVFSFFGRTVNAVTELARLRRNYADLAEKMERYEIFERTAAEIRQENYRLKEQLDFSLSLQYKRMAAEITGRDPDNLYHAFSVNKGKKHGVKVNMCVTAYQNGTEALVGTVVQAGFFESLIMPVYSDKAYISARFVRSRYEGLVEGQGAIDFPLRMRLITKRARDEIQEGDLVITSGLGGVYPAGITIGRVNNLYFEEGLTSLETELAPSIDFSRLEYVFIVMSDMETEEKANAVSSTSHGRVNGD